MERYAGYYPSLSSSISRTGGARCLEEWEEGSGCDDTAALPLQAVCECIMIPYSVSFIRFPVSVLRHVKKKFQNYDIGWHLDSRVSRLARIRISRFSMLQRSKCKLRAPLYSQFTRFVYFNVYSFCKLPGIFSGLTQHTPKRLNAE